ncbi:hypothetical protein AhSzq1_37 [Aeromonas phage AhSzq-1]|jgi:hypothetical protein|uniref:Uncharacterized protein n=2 Tax=Shenzhenvirus TaxID=2732038 RepID=A0A2R4ALK1_9CAUD|nr:hypothetical protein HOT03_gp037 [Aeromonas phage AhSzq-1]YP_009800225.1 hypothetical protein HOT04_gp032 [Aeromonas phage AhSzw-1]AVR75930.1 hypothetical protein AhSzq1_37 [Aeromonas phage AhSzq-1]AVR76068.1 hypothetical protein AhSzw1_32 [Aeromonas phage AhSzw-1]
MPPKYKTERQLKARVYEMAVQNKMLLDLLSFNIQDLQKATQDGMTAEEAEAVLSRTMAKIKEVNDGKAAI